MTSSSCPCCGDAIQKLQPKAVNPLAYCQSCGWNVARAQEFLSFRGRIIAIALIFLSVVTCVFAAVSPNFRNGLEDGLLILGMLGILGVVAWRKMSRDAQALAGVQADANGVNRRPRAVPEPDVQALAHFYHVRSLERPRLVQLNQSARLAHALTMIPPFGMWLWGIHDLLWPDRPIGLAAHGPVEARLWAGIVLGCGTVLWFLLRRTRESEPQLSLLKNGEVALGRVIGPRPHSAALPGIAYEFRDSQDRAVQGLSADIQGTTNEDDYVLVFFDAGQPKESIALCATNYEFADARNPILRES